LPFANPQHHLDCYLAMIDGIKTEPRSAVPFQIKEEKK